MVMKIHVQIWHDKFVSLISNTKYIQSARNKVLLNEMRGIRNQKIRDRLFSRRFKPNSTSP